MQASMGGIAQCDKTNNVAYYEDIIAWMGDITLDIRIYPEQSSHYLFLYDVALGYATIHAFCVTSSKSSFEPARHIRKTCPCDLYTP